MEYVCKYAPLTLFAAYAVKMLAFTASFQDAIIMLGLMGLAAFFEFKPAQSEIKALRQEVQTMQENIKIIHQRVEETRTSVVGMKLASGMSPKNITQLKTF